MKRLIPPTNQKQEVLYCLLTNDNINVRQMMADTGILNIKARISELRLQHHLPIQTEMIKVQNKFQRSVKFGSWSLTDKTKALQTYLKMIENDH